MSTLIQIQSVTKSYGPVPLLDDVSVTFGKGDKVGVIGRNGAGKSTLCKLVLGEEEADAGVILRAPRLRLGYLEQRTPFRAGETVQTFLERYTGREGWECGKAAGRFQLKHGLLNTVVTDLPGGYQTRVKLAALTLRDPNFLILDEPTNYLDLRTLLLLERFLAVYSGGFLIVSHDREFLRRTCNQTLDVELGRLDFFPGQIDEYLAYKAEQREVAERFNRNIEAKRKDLAEFVARYRVRASTASRAQSKLRQMEKLRPVEIAGELSRVHIRMPPAEARKGVALRCEGLAIGYPERTVARDVRVEIERGQKVAVLGDNGQGKTTFLRTIAGELPPLFGEWRWGHGIETAYYAQHVYASIPERHTVYDWLQREAHPDVTRQEVLDMAGSFLFRGEEVDKPVRVLSGGERARLCLAALLLGKRAVLLLDEPTNHLDFETVEALGRALHDYAGTIFFVSHDRTFVSLVATSIVEVKDGTVTMWPGDYDSYVWRARQEVEEEDEEARAAASSKSGKRDEHSDRAINIKDRRKELRARIRELEKCAKDHERSVSELQSEREAIHRYYLENPTLHSPEKAAREEELRTLIEEAEMAWMTVLEQMEPLVAELEKL